MALAALRSKAVVLLLLTFCLLLLPFWKSVIVLCFVVRYFMSILVLQSSWRGRESWYHKLRKTFSKFYRRYYDLISKFQVGLKSLLRQVLSEPDFYGDLVYKLKKIVGSNNFSAQFIKIISHYKKDWL